jgi:anthranilate synthase component 1
LNEKPLFYYKQIIQKLPNSYFAEDETQVIIGIDCDYFEGENLDRLGEFYERSKGAKNWGEICDFAGIFGVMAWNIVYKFEKIGAKKRNLYDFPTLLYANAKSYLHYDKIAQNYTFYGENLEFFEWLKTCKNSENLDENMKFSYEICTDLNNEKENFFKMVETAKEFIAKGDVFQVVLGEILELSTTLDAIKFYEILSAQNPSPYMFCFPSKFGVVVGSSPELILEMRNGSIFVAPIAGTRPRTGDLREDERRKNELLCDEKELAEHRMLVDLARNDISKFATPNSVSVKNLMRVVFYESVMHIKSEVYGAKRADAGIFDVLSVVFPAGTLSGSPKIRAMQIIGELEPSGRGIYGGGIGFFHFNGDMQMAILIRSAIFIKREFLDKFRKNLVENSGNLGVLNPAQDENLFSLSQESGEIYHVFIGAGAGIVWDSKAQNEYAEICAKRESLVKIFKQNCELNNI